MPKKLGNFIDRIVQVLVLVAILVGSYSQLFEYVFTLISHSHP